MGLRSRNPGEFGVLTADLACETACRSLHHAAATPALCTFQPILSVRSSVCLSVFLSVYLNCLPYCSFLPLLPDGWIQLTYNADTPFDFGSHERASFRTRSGESEKSGGRAMGRKSCMAPPDSASVRKRAPNSRRTLEGKAAKRMLHAGCAGPQRPVD